MHTTQQWWDKVSSSETEMIKWLKDQYHGEVTAENRIRESIQKYYISDLEVKLINSIADDEAKHALWIKKLLTDRGVVAEILTKEERYWDATLPNALEKNTFSYFCAVAAHAETMRLERINLLRQDSRFVDIAEVFEKIYPDELFHARMFTEMTDKESLKEALVYHDIGRNAIGLVA